jgi:hypothetical protein
VTPWAAFGAGLLTGGTLGVLLMACLVAASRADECRGRKVSGQPVDNSVENPLTV